MDIQQRVASGVAWLDENYPNWEGRVNPDTLFMMNASGCVLGQLLGNYWNAGLSAEDSASMGFNITHNGGGDMFKEYTELQEEWQRFIGERRAQ